MPDAIHALDDRGTQVDAAFEVEEAPEGFDVVIHSRSSRPKKDYAPNNSAYNVGFDLMLGRLKKLATRVAMVTIDSRPMRGKSIDDRRLDVPNHPYPISLASVEDLRQLRKAIGRVSSGYNRRIRLRVQLPSLWAMENLTQFLVRGGTEYTGTDNDVELANSPEDDIVIARTEGGLRYVISPRIERDSRARQDAIRIHGLSCQVCHFNFKKTYGDWGADFIEVHHAQLLASHAGTQTLTDFQNDLAVLCANCHRMVHRKRGAILSIKELRELLQVSG